MVLKFLVFWALICAVLVGMLERRNLLFFSRKYVYPLYRAAVLSYITLKEPKLRGLVWRKLKNWNWEKISVIGLAVCLAAIMLLALAGGVFTKDAVLEPDPTGVFGENMQAASEDTDLWYFKGLGFIFSVMEGDSKDFRNYSNYHKAAHFAASLVSLLVPALAAVAAFILLWNYLPHHVPMNSATWFLFSELDQNSVRMAKSIHSQMGSKNNVYIFLRTRRGHVDPELYADIQSLNIFFYPRDEARFLYWRRRGHRIMRFFFLSENTDENFSRMKDFLDAVERDSLFTPTVALPDGSFQHELYLLSETESASLLITKLREQISSSSKANAVFAHTELRLLDRFRAVSYDLLRSQPIHRFRNGSHLNVLVLGFGRIGREFFRAACSLGVMHGCSTNFILCDLEIERKLNSFGCQCPELRQSVQFRAEELDAESDQIIELVQSGEYHYIVVALGDDERNIRVATRLKRYYRKCHWEKVQVPQPQICVNIEDTIKHTYIGDLWKTDAEWDRSLHVFGGLEQAFSADVLMPKKLWLAARYIHKTNY